MLERRTFIAGLAAFFAVPSFAGAAKKKKRRRFRLNPKYAPQRVFFPGYSAGTIVVDPRRRFLYLVEGFGFARRYGVGVGRAGLAWKGTAKVGRKAKWPSGRQPRI